MLFVGHNIKWNSQKDCSDDTNISYKRKRIAIIVLHLYVCLSLMSHSPHQTQKNVSKFTVNSINIKTQTLFFQYFRVISLISLLLCFHFKKKRNNKLKGSKKNSRESYSLKLPTSIRNFKLKKNLQNNEMKLIL